MGCRLSAVLAAALVSPLAPAEPADWFVDVSAAAGLDFVHFNGMSGELYFPEMMGAGAALFDYDNDGDLDVYLVQGAMLGPGKSLEDATFPPPAGKPLTDRLYRNDLTVLPDGTRRLTFTDVTEAAGLALGGYGMGVAAGDVDNDGWIDLYVTAYGDNHLLRNLGDGRFADVTTDAGVADPRWSVSAAFLDYDGDGALDLYVGNYVSADLAGAKRCFLPSGAPDYCAPGAYRPLPDRLLHNLGDGRFEDVSVASGVGAKPGNGLGVAVADFNGDGLPDIYVGNDQMANFLWVNRGGGTFGDEGLMAGVAANMDGSVEASMGVDAADFDADGDEDLFMTHLRGETNTLYENDGSGWFEDRTLAAGLGAASKPLTAFGTAWLDADNDGLLDLFVAAGDVQVIEARAAAGDPFPLDQPNQLFLNRGDAGFEEVSARAGGVFALEEVSRGVAVGDMDNDGDADILVTQNAGPARLLLNTRAQDRPWLGLRLLTEGGRDALGARVEVRLPGGRGLWRRVRADGSYACANDPRILVGLGDAEAVERVRIHWPDGRVETRTDLPLRTYTTLREGAAAADLGE
jgi:hypothetical protein